MVATPISDEEWARTQAALESSGGNQSAAALALGIPRETLRSRVLSARARGVAPDGPPLEGFQVKGTSVLYDGEGNIKATWLKTSVDPQQQEQMLRETIAAFIAEIKPINPCAAPKINDADICVAYCIGDAHLGLYAWGSECGDDFDLSVAQKDLMAAADRLVDAAPPSSEALVVQLGDFYHMDDSTFATPKSGNRLDVDSRFPKVIRAGIKTMRYMIDKALEKHKTVRVRNVAGNHDPHASVTLTEALIGYYSKEPRVIIEDSPQPYFFHRFGSNLVGITHGHAGKPEKFPGIMARDAKKDWGDCDFKYFWHGHIHNKKVFEDIGVLVESFRTLAAKDAWHTEQGYGSGREMQAIVLHKDFGEIERHTAGLKRVRADA